MEISLHQDTVMDIMHYNEDTVMDIMHYNEDTVLDIVLQYQYCLGHYVLQC